jgi:hypothetical protein
MSCDVELITETHEDALYVPVQCVVRVDDQPRVYVQDGSDFVPRNIEVGMDNNTMIHVLSGVQKGEVVMLAPPVSEEAVVKEEDEDMPSLPPGVKIDQGLPEGGDPDDAVAKPGADDASGRGDGESERPGAVQGGGSSKPRRESKGGRSGHRPE